MSEEETVIRFPKTAAQQLFYPTIVEFNEGYRQSLRDRSWKLAPYLWALVEGGPGVTWEQAATDKRYSEATAKCIATAELCIRLIDVINCPLAHGQE